MPPDLQVCSEAETEQRALTLITPVVIPSASLHLRKRSDDLAKLLLRNGFCGWRGYDPYR